MSSLPAFVDDEYIRYYTCVPPEEYLKLREQVILKQFHLMELMFPERLPYLENMLYALKEGRFSFQEAYEDGVRASIFPLATWLYGTSNRKKQNENDERLRRSMIRTGDLPPFASFTPLNDLCSMAYAWFEIQGEQDERKIFAPDQPWVQAFIRFLADYFTRLAARLPAHMRIY